MSEQATCPRYGSMSLPLVPLEFPGESRPFQALWDGSAPLRDDQHWISTLQIKEDDRSEIDRVTQTGTKHEHETELALPLRELALIERLVRAHRVLCLGAMSAGIAAFCLGVVASALGAVSRPELMPSGAALIAASLFWSHRITTAGLNKMVALRAVERGRPPEPWSTTAGRRNESDDSLGRA